MIPKLEAPLVDFFVPGKAEPGGSKRAFMKPGMKFPIIVDDNPKTKTWKKDVATCARVAYHGKPVSGPLNLSLYFVRAWRQGDLRSDGSIKDPTQWPVSRPDVLKLARSTEDALTGIIWIDDSQIVIENLVKSYGTNPGVRIIVHRIQGGPS